MTRTQRAALAATRCDRQARAADRTEPAYAATLRANAAAWRDLAGLDA